MKRIFKVVAQGETFAVASQKAESGQVNKCNIVLREIGSKYENSFVAAMLGKLASCRFYPDELVYAALRFSVREHNGMWYQDAVVSDIVKIDSCG